MADYVDTWANWSAAHPGMAAVIDETTFDRWKTIASRLIDRITGWPDDTFVISGSTSYYVDGGDRPFLELPKPPVTVTAVEEVTTRAVSPDPEVLVDLDGTYWMAWTRQYPRDRALRRIERLPRRSVWLDGPERWKVTGTFGYVTDASATPPEIEEVCGKLILLLDEDDDDGGTGDAMRRGFVQSFKTDKFSYSLGAGVGGGAGAGVLPGTLTGRADIDGVLAMFRPAPPTGYGALRRSHRLPRPPHPEFN